VNDKARKLKEAFAYSKKNKEFINFFTSFVDSKEEIDPAG